jgi:hypothetical protein
MALSQVGEYAAQLVGIAADDGQLADGVRQGDPGAGRALGERRRDGAEQRRQIHIAHLERVFAVLHFADVEDVIDDGEQLPCGIVDEMRVVRGLIGAQTSPVVLA